MYTNIEIGNLETKTRESEALMMPNDFHDDVVNILLGQYNKWVGIHAHYMMAQISDKITPEIEAEYEVVTQSLDRNLKYYVSEQSNVRPIVKHIKKKFNSLRLDRASTLTLLVREKK
ncbi:MAG: hypothetical protein U9R08_00350 [Nanoarchaeota archaeon]|nr:hypothetical protein [Nanoarchaeota archaeon]